MKKTLILTVIVIFATLFSGCQDQQLADCQEKNAQLQQTIEYNKIALDKANDMANGAVRMVSDLLLGDERIRRDLVTAKKQNEALKKEVARLKEELSRTPEERANIRKGVEQLMQLQKDSAENLIKAKEAKEAGQN